MVGFLFIVLSTIVLFVGALVIIYVGGAVATGAPIILLLPILDDWIVQTLWRRMTVLMVVVDDLITSLRRWS
jgi:hypothetical protein